jgi:hypothetical protein
MPERARRETVPASRSVGASVAPGTATSDVAGWIGRLLRRIRTLGRSSPDSSGPDAGPLMAFAAEEPAAPSGDVTAGGASSLWPRARVPIVIAGLVVVTAAGTFAANRMLPVRASTVGTEPGRLSVETQPAGATVIIDGASRGVTPLALSLQPGTHTMTIRGDQDERSIALTVTPGADIARYFEMKTSPRVEVGGLSIVTDPPGVRVNVDGRPAGKSPLTVENLSAADHKVTVTNDQTLSQRTVHVEAGATTSIVFSLAKAAAPGAGWLSIKAPFEVQLFEGANVIGTGDMAKVMLPAGRHDIVMLNRALQYQETRRITVAAEAVTSVRVDAPKANLSANARPWAEVTIDGTSVGQTPIANLAVPIGTHEIVFRHPQLGERRQSVTVTVNGPNRISVDLTKE